MVIHQRTNWRTVITSGTVAGVVAGIIMEMYGWLTIVVPQHASLVTTWQWIASTVIGNVAFTTSAFAMLGLAAHFIVSIAWASGYAYLASRQAFMNRRWVISGLVYGLVVYLFMQLILLGDGNLKPPATPNDFINALILHMVFFGLPLAFVVARLTRS